ncbi:MAG: hypothetical protein WCI57_02825 [Candidatus Berkelbacteria bacterium]
MENEQIDRKAMTLKDLLMTISRENIETEIKNHITPELLNQVSVEAVADSIVKTLSAPEGVFVNKTVEFDSIHSLLKEQIPADEDDEAPKFELNTLKGDEDSKIVNEQARKIFQDLVGEETEHNFSGNILGEAFVKKSTFDPLQKLIFVENYNNLPIDVRQTLHWLAERGVKLVIASDVDEKRPFDNFSVNGNDYIESDCLKNGLENVPQLRISEKRIKESEKVA